jgi:hypothetical protein
VILNNRPNYGGLEKYSTNIKGKLNFFGGGLSPQLLPASAPDPNRSTTLSELATNIILINGKTQQRKMLGNVPLCEINVCPYSFIYHSGLVYESSDSSKDLDFKSLD